MKIKRRLFLSSLLAGVTSDSVGDENSGSHALTLNIQSIEKKEIPGKHSLIVKLCLKNPTTMDFSLWTSDSRRGWRMFRFAFIDSSGAFICVDRVSRGMETLPQDTFDALKAGRELSYSFDLFDGTWTWPSVTGTGDANRFVVYLDNPRSKAEATLWSGHLESIPFQLEGTLKNYVPSFERLVTDDTIRKLNQARPQERK